MVEVNKALYSYNHEINDSYETSNKSNIEFAKNVIYISQNGDEQRSSELYKKMKNIKRHSKITSNLPSQKAANKTCRNPARFFSSKIKDLEANAKFQPNNPTQGLSLAFSRLDSLAMHSKSNNIGEFIGRILAHAVLDNINDGNLNITGINNKLLRKLTEYSVLGEINSQDKRTDQYYRSLGKRKRFIYRKAYQKVKKIISQPSKSTKQIKGWKSKRLHKVTSGIKCSLLDQPEIKNVHLKGKISVLINQYADTYVANSSLYIDRNYKVTKKQQLGYGISTGFILVLRERAPSVLKNLALIDNMYNTYDAMVTAKNTVTYSNLNTAFDNYFGDSLNNINSLVSDITKAVSNATNEVSFNKFLTACNNYWF